MPEYAAQSVEKVSVTAFSVVWVGIVRPSSPVQTITNPMDVLTISLVESELDLSVSFRVPESMAVQIGPQCAAS
jgi:hypothetical protein